ncbi:MAG: DUF4382 domain-containing protein [Bacteroidota bacterium]
MKKLILMASFIVFGVVLTSCSSDSSNDSAKYAYKVRMTDAPGPYDEVNIDLQAVEVIGSNGQAVTLTTTAGIYNLLDLSNGLSTIIATSGLVDVEASQIRLILGANNTIVLNGITYPLSTPSADQTGLKINVDQTLMADVENIILIDFDANTSVVETGAGTYKLKPVLRTVDVVAAGRITGSITPIGALAVVTATSATGVAYSSNANALGQFEVSGLAPGTYSFMVTPVLPALPVTILNVTVTAGVATNVGVVVL